MTLAIENQGINSAQTSVKGSNGIIIDKIKISLLNKP